MSEVARECATRRDTKYRIPDSRIDSVVACRNMEKGQKVVDEIKTITGNDKSARCMKLDLLSLAAVKEFADEFTANYDTLHCLMNNAGVMNCPYGLSKDGMS